MASINDGLANRRDETPAQAQSLITNLVDFLKDYDAQKNPPVTDISRYELYLLREEDLPPVDEVVVTGGAENWMTIAFAELPTQPRVPESVAEYLLPNSGISATVRPVPAAPNANVESDTAADDTEGHLLAAEAWVSQVWSAWADRYADAQRAKKFYRNIFEQSQLIGGDRETYELVWGRSRASSAWRSPIFPQGCRARAARASTLRPARSRRRPARGCCTRWPGGPHAPGGGVHPARSPAGRGSPRGE